MKTEYPKIQICNNCNYLFAEYSYSFFCCEKCQREYLLKRKYRKTEIHIQKQIFKILPIYEVFKTEKRLCNICKKDISHKRKDAKYCCQECRTKAAKEQKEHEKNII